MAVPSVNRVRTGIEQVGSAVLRRLPLPGPARWWMVRAYFSVFGWLHRGTPAWEAYLRQRQFLEDVRGSGVARPRPSDRADPPPPRAAGTADVLLFGAVDYTYRRQRPQHIADAFARDGHRVFYISPNFIDHRASGFWVQRMDEHSFMAQIHLCIANRPRLYQGRWRNRSIEQARTSLSRLIEWANLEQGLCLINHPAWIQVAPVPRSERLVYDCLDHHAGFDNSDPAVEMLEHELLRRADAVVTSSRQLHDRCRTLGAAPVLIRNACDFEFFSRRPETVYRAPAGDRVIGYFGAVASWFDIELIMALARSEPQFHVIIVGADTAGARRALASCANVSFTGETPYDRLPFYLHGMDVCLIPFRINPLTCGADPVKVYEYLAAGKPVVSTRLPELEPLSAQGLVRVADDPEAFIEHVRAAAAEKPDAPAAERRVAFASQQTWTHRYRQFRDAALKP